MLNFGDFSRYARSFKAVKRGNFLGLPVNFVLFSLLTVLTAAATLPVYGRLITDPVETVAQIDSTFAVVLGAVTFTTATIGINIVANFIAPAFDFSNVSPQKISWRAGGMIAAVGSVLLTPWNWYANDTAIHYTLGILGALIGPLFGVLIADYYLVRRQRIAVDAMYSMSDRSAYWYRGGYNPDAITATAVAGAVAIASVLLPRLLGQGLWVSDWSWFVGCGLGLVVYRALALRPGSPTLAAMALAETEPDLTDGTTHDARPAAPAVVDVR